MAANVPPPQVPPPDQYVPPPGMGDLMAQTIQDWIGQHLDPMQGQLAHVFGHIYVGLSQVLDVC